MEKGGFWYVGSGACGFGYGMRRGEICEYGGAWNGK